ncbi:hypothetical protein L226DRAFT_342135 [Lentinus tigrinus ALCF2SS1-7]|uniref:Uncharacterized protein n=1 Tax=Lentinus tigrinus ALCF2SS1-6 TaxID=1328759 RepID=A0A5C2RXJ0_9APHY|nr:hypothetical protein L227DRAFT_299781 [Lentinus tigrinus ALCF2SS1-6]RPD68554.1 hypothetical protein L226DRAFT_342135 [Lentinus tigrinus ALCF2SS1-7]
MAPVASADTVTLARAPPNIHAHLSPPSTISEFRPLFHVFPSQSNPPPSGPRLIHPRIPSAPYAIPSGPPSEVFSILAPIDMYTTDVHRSLASGTTASTIPALCNQLFRSRLRPSSPHPRVRASGLQLEFSSITFLHSAAWAAWGSGKPSSI